MRVSRLLPAVVAGSLLMAACGGTSDGDAATPVTEPTEQATTDSAAPAPAAEPTGNAAPASLQFSAPLVGGGEIDATTLAGKPTLFWFWAPN